MWSRAGMDILKKRIPCPCWESPPRSSTPYHCYYTEYSFPISTQVTGCNMQLFGKKKIHILLLRWKFLQFSWLALNFSLTDDTHLPEFWIMKFGLGYQHKNRRFHKFYAMYSLKLFLLSPQISHVPSWILQNFFSALTWLQGHDYCPLTGQNPGLLLASLLDITTLEDIHM